jgi:hypothetical protein
VDLERYLNSSQAAEFLTSLGYQTAPRYFKILVAPSGRAPLPADRIYGGRNLWREATLLRWAESRCRMAA